MREPDWQVRSGISDIREAERNLDQIQREAARVYAQIQHDIRLRERADGAPLRVRMRAANRS